MYFKTQKAFSFVELLISMVIIAILGGAALMVLWFSIGSYSQMDDYTSAESEMEYAVQRLSRDFALIGLGMPNNRKGVGSFASTFSLPDNPPVMAFFGSTTDTDTIWGGPVTVANATTGAYSAATITNPGLSTASPDLLGPGGAYVGPELYYAWAVPTGVKARFSTVTGATEVEVKKNDVVKISELFAVSKNVDGKSCLESVRYDGLNGNFHPSASGNSVKKWLLFPTLRLPMMAEEWRVEDGKNVLMTRVAPSSQKDVTGTVMGLDEIHLIQAARLFRNDQNELVRVVFDTESSSQSEVLARNVVGLHFTYNPRLRILTMYIAVSGMEADGVGHSRAQPQSWPSWLPPIAESDLRYRILTKSLTWRIRN
jgi:prepilin-type N-terminal cleavage/methylation domain-containing protein